MKVIRTYMTIIYGQEVEVKVYATGKHESEEITRPVSDLQIIQEDNDWVPPAKDLVDLFKGLKNAQTS